MIEITGVRFKPVGKVYYFDPKGLKLSLGDRVIVETVRGQEIGEVVTPNKEVEENEKFMPLSPVVRLATEEDFAQDRKNKEKQEKAFRTCQERIKKHKLDMTLVDVEYTFDNSKIIFSFVADGRVDFRELVKDLASVFKTRIELRQIGVRDETKAIGGLGICGRKVCCASFLSEFVPVSVKMAKDQFLSTNPQKISGTCGKLICCLNFEEEVYEEAYKALPRNGSLVKTPDGNGTVVELLPLAESVRVRLLGEEGTVKTYEKKDISVLRSGKKEEESPKVDKENDET